MGARDVPASASPHLHPQKPSLKSHDLQRQALLLQHHEKIREAHDSLGSPHNTPLAAHNRAGSDVVGLASRYQSSTVSSSAHVSMSPAPRIGRTTVGASAPAASSVVSPILCDQDGSQTDIPLHADYGHAGLKNKKNSSMCLLEALGNADDDPVVLQKESHTGLALPNTTNACSDAHVPSKPAQAAALGRDRRRVPGHRVSFDEGLWPASSTITLSGLAQFGNKSVSGLERAMASEIQADRKGNLPRQNGLSKADIFVDSRDTVRTPSEGTRNRSKTVQPFMEAAKSPGYNSYNSPGHRLDGLRPSRMLHSQSSDNMECAMKLVDSQTRSDKKGKVRSTSSPSSQREKFDGAPLGKQLGEHFENLDSTHVRQQLVQSADGDDISRSKLKKKSSMAGNGSEPWTPVRNPKQGESMKPKLECILEVPAPKDASSGATKRTSSSSSTSLTRAVASLLVPSRYKGNSSKKEVKLTGPPFGLTRSASHSAGSTTFTGLDAKVAGRSMSFDGREATTIAIRTLKGGAILKGACGSSTQATDRACKSLNDSIDSSGGAASDTESSSSGGSASRLGILNTRRWLSTGGDSTVSPASYVKRYMIKSGSPGGMVDVGDGALSSKRSSGRETNGRRSSSLLAWGWEAIPARSIRRLEHYAALDVALLLNRYLQWRFLNASVNASIQAQVEAAEVRLILKL